mmetsp:Transcript_19552/g.34877  ORF Transcript_19552/g.34877 Transcript_19552/m.34877 type:complete len:348 (-) Transcript_19552:183-1226(-)
MRLEAGVVHASNLGVRLQRTGEPESVFVASLHAEVQRLEAAQDEVGSMRVHGATQHVVHRTNRVDGLLFARDAAGQHIVVPCHILGGRVDDQIGTQRQSLLVNGCGKGGVDANQRALLVALLSDGGHIHTPQVRVCGRLGKVEGNIVLLQCLIEGVHVRRVNDGGRNAHLWQDSLDKLPRASVAVSGGHNVAAGGHQGQQHRRRAVHAAAAQQAVICALQCHDLCLARPSRWVAIPAIFVGAVSPLLVGNQLCGVFEGVGGGLHNRRRERVANARTSLALATMDRLRPRAVLGGSIVGGRGGVQRLRFRRLLRRARAYGGASRSRATHLDAARTGYASPSHGGSAAH